MKNTLDLDMQLTEHFRLREFVISAEAIRRGIDNTPPPVAIEALKLLCENVLEPLRRRFGVIRITSGYRCKEVNDRVGGAGGSQHMLGEAADIHVSNDEMMEKMCFFINDHIDFDQAIFYHINKTGKRWIHISYSIRHKCRHNMIVRRTR